jgi:hypothetical protein
VCVCVCFSFAEFVACLLVFIDSALLTLQGWEALKNRKGWTSRNINYKTERGNYVRDNFGTRYRTPAFFDRCAGLRASLEKGGELQNWLDFFALHADLAHPSLDTEIAITNMHKLAVMLGHFATPWS